MCPVARQRARGPHTHTHTHTRRNNTTALHTKGFFLCPQKPPQTQHPVGRRRQPSSATKVRTVQHGPTTTSQKTQEFCIRTISRSPFFLFFSLVIISRGVLSAGGGILRGGVSATDRVWRMVCETAAPSKKGRWFRWQVSRAVMDETRWTASERDGWMWLYHVRRTTQAEKVYLVAA